jgi:hypothetical protein
MNLHVRPPLSDEWPICRMLLPETFAEASQREYLLCLRDESPRIVGAASFRRGADAVTHLRVHVVSSFRRRRIGSQIVAYIARSGVRALGGNCETVSEPAAAPFCERNRFQRADALTTVEGEIAGMREYMCHLRTRVPGGFEACTVPLSAVPVEQVAQLHSQYVAHQSELNPWRGLLADAPGMNHSPVVLVGGRVVGILLWELQGGTAVVRSRVAVPGPHGKWVNVILLAAGLDGAWAQGARRVRFSYTDTNRDTRKLALRFKAEVASVLVEYRREITG